MYRKDRRWALPFHRQGAGKVHNQNKPCAGFGKRQWKVKKPIESGNSQPAKGELTQGSSSCYQTGGEKSMGILSTALFSFALGAVVTAIGLLQDRKGERK
ncbi:MULTISPECIES: hypothetical protein [Eubacteriales]|uniref:hypothetical protein n=1 Tax=Eubacteriales TaxID=186802 RepID=UPI0003966F60|nr:MULTISPECIES: hypothetical protein [Eubacteriales]ERJ00965.1 hypothetical protein HMPREF0262_00301 [Clostridium sp. ATCC 29733]